METAFCTLVVFDTFEVLTIIRISCACVAFLYFRDYNSTNRLFYFLFCFVTITATMTTTMAMITEEIKTRAPFFESSPMLYDISQTLPSWDRVARGLIRLYEGEVLHKRVVVQHLKFTKLFPCTWTPSRSERIAPTENYPGTNAAVPPTGAKQR